MYCQSLSTDDSINFHFVHYAKATYSLYTYFTGRWYSTVNTALY